MIPKGTTTEPIPDIISVTESSEDKFYEPGELIFEDNFDILDPFKWEHEITMAGDKIDTLISYGKIDFKFSGSLFAWVP